jgi:hypothetical protein
MPFGLKRNLVRIPTDLQASLATEAHLAEGQLMEETLIFLTITITTIVI